MLLLLVGVVHALELIARHSPGFSEGTCFEEKCNSRRGLVMEKFGVTEHLE